MIRKWCHWCGKPSRGTALERRPTPVGWGMELGGRFASCGGCGTAFYATPEALTERDAEHEGGA